MKRSEFFKRIVGGAIAVAVAPEVLKAKDKPKVLSTKTVEWYEKTEGECKKQWEESLTSNPPRKTSLNYLQNFREHYDVTEKGYHVIDSKFVNTFSL